MDKMGRVVIPKEIRAQLDVKNEKDCFEIYMDGDRVILQKYHPTCVFCEEILDTVTYAGRTVCRSCIEKLKALSEEQED